MKISLFFSNYLVDRKTRYLWNGFNLSFLSVDVGIGQISPFLLFVDDGLFIS